MVLATPLDILYPGAQLDSGLRHVDVVIAAGLDILAAPWLWAITVFPPPAPALLVLVLMEWTGVLQGGGGGRVFCSWVWGWQLPGVETQAPLPQLMHQLHRPSAWPGDG